MFYVFNIFLIISSGIYAAVENILRIGFSQNSKFRLKPKKNNAVHGFRSINATANYPRTPKL